MPASPGAAVGDIVFDNDEAVARAEAGESVILVRRETNPDDLPGMVAAAGVLTARGGKTSPRRRRRPRHGQDLRVRRRGPGGRRRRAGPCASPAARTSCSPPATSSPSTGTTGEVFLGEVPVVDSPVMTYLRRGLETALDAAGDVDTRELVTQRGPPHAPRGRGAAACRCAPTPTPPTTPATPSTAAPRASACAAPSTCSSASASSSSRTSSWPQSDDEREEALAALLPLQKGDFIQHVRDDERQAHDGAPHRPAAARVPAGPDRAERQGGRGP